MRKPGEVIEREIHKEFTDRVEPIAEFQKWYKKSSDHLDDFFVLSFYGIGGIGKSSLIDYLCRDLTKNSGVFVKYDFEYATGLDPYNILVGIKQSIRNRYADLFRFPLFNTALLMLAKKSSVSFENDELVKSVVAESPYLQILVELLSAFPIIGGYLKNAATIISQISADVENLTIKDELKKKYRHDMEEMVHLEADELRKKMPQYFWTDMAENMKSLSKPFVIFLDTYEKYIDTFKASSNVVLDSWLRESTRSLIQRIPGILWVICGRDRLTWADDGEWDDDHLTCHEVCDFKNLDSRMYLNRAGITDGELVSHICNITDGVPIYLDLCVDTYYLLKDKGRLPNVKNFEIDRRKIANSYVKYLDPINCELVYMLASMGKWSDEDAKYVGEKMHSGTFSVERYNSMMQHSFIKESAEKKRMHDVMVEAMLSEIDESTLNDVNGNLFHYRVTKLENELASFTDIISLVNDAVESYRKIYKQDVYIEQYSDFRKLINKISEISERGFINEGLNVAALLNEHCEKTYRGTKYQGYSLYLKGIALWRAGIYQTALECSRDAYKLMSKLLGERHSDTLKSQFNIAVIYNEMERYKEALDVNLEVYNNQVQEFGKENRDTLASYNTLGILYGNLEQYDEALNIFKDAYEIRGRLFGEDNPGTIKCLNNIGVTHTRMGLYEEASKELQEVYTRMKKVVGEEHPYTIAIIRNIGTNYKGMGDYGKALEKLKQAYEGFTKVLGENHPETQRVFKLISEVIV